MLEVESAISPEVIQARGYWTAESPADLPEGFADYQTRRSMFPILVIPQWNTVGRATAHILRPDHPRKSREGDVIKYEAQPGAPVGFDCPPSMVRQLRDARVPLYITEGSKKADAMTSRGLLCLSLNGVYAFLHKRVVVSELDELEIEGRTVRLIFDDDVMIKPGVADALDRLSAAIDKRGGRVESVILCDPKNPDAPAGTAKIGVDDYFARGGQIAMLSELTMPWRAVRRPKQLREYQDPYAEIARLQALTSAQAQLITNPLLKDKERAIGFRLITLAGHRKSAGEVGPDGKPRLRASDIAQDYRARPSKGEALPPVNPDGSHPITRRQNVKSIVEALTRAGVLSVGIEPTTRIAPSGDRYADTDLVVDIEDTTKAIVNLANYRVEKPRKPYTRQEPCPHCGEVHARTVIRQTICGTEDDPGCGAVLNETTLTLPVPPASDPNATPEQREDLEERTTTSDGSPKFGEAIKPVNSSPSPTPINYSSPNFGEPEPEGHIRVCVSCELPRSGDGRPCPTCGATESVLIDPTWQEAAS